MEYSRDLDYRSVLYKQTPLPKPETDLTIVSIQDPKTAEVVATAINQKKVSSPYVVKSGNFWYFADKPLSFMGEGTRYLVLCDLLHDILGINHPSEMRAMVRIEDVSIDDDPDDLTNIATWLSDRHIPFGIAIIPIFRDPAHSLEIRLGDRKSTVEAIHTMIALGGTPIMHGITHQVHGLSGDEYEFWDELGNRAVGGDSAEFVIRRLRMGFAECFANDIYPWRLRSPITGHRILTTALSANLSPCSMTAPWSRPTIPPPKWFLIQWWTSMAATSSPKHWDIFPEVIPTRRKGYSDRPRHPGGARTESPHFTFTLFCRKHCLSR